MAAIDCDMKVVFFISTCLLFLIFPAASSHPRDPFLRKQASLLVSLKQSLQATNVALSTWNISNYKSLCSWTGITCEKQNNKSIIVSLDISNLNLSGSLSPVITQLRSLRNFSVAGNSFSGTFPPRIHELSSLQYLNISQNQFNGTLDWEFSDLKKLIVLDAYDNNFYGFLPLGIARLEKLEYLDLGGNFLSGEIPSSYGNMLRLNYLSLAGNDLRGLIPFELSNLTDLKYLRLGYFNAFKGGIPRDFGKLSNLVHLDLASCGLDGPIPQELGNLKQLDTIFLQANQLSGSLPPQLGDLVCLKLLDVSNNGLSGEIPSEFSALRVLTVFNLFMNKFHGEIPPFVAELPNLRTLNLWRNNFTGSIPQNLGLNGMLTSLDLSTNKLTGLIPKNLCSGGKLTTLILLNNFLFGPLPDELGQCRTLERVRIAHNYLSGSIPNGLVYLPDLTLLELQNNYLTGQLAERPLGEKSTKLTELNLSNNRFSGPLPSSIENLKALQNLNASGNCFTGEIPPEIGQMKNVLKLDLSRNNFSGGIPAGIGNCVSLTNLDLSQNRLSGQIPIQLSQIHILNYFNVSWNHLNGSLPKEIGSMKSLTSADFSHNNFSGVIPENGQYSLFNYTSFIGNPFLCGSSCNFSSSSAFKSHRNSRNQAKLVFALGLFFCCLIFGLLATIKTQKWRRRNNDASSWKLMAFQKLSFRSHDILECLSDNNIIGKGGAGIVYRGTMPNGEQVAVKKLLGRNKLGSSHGHDHGLSAEIQTLGRIRHRNIVRLLAFCSNKETNLLVFEYMPNGSLGEILHGKRGAHLRWNTRLKIAIEAAKGLSYLHHDCSPLIVHRDVKSNNILLNSDFEAHVADFGLAKFLQDNGASECMSAIAGSYGYIAPEYAYTLKVDEKSDVYSYGVVLLELLTGRKPVGDFEEEGLDIVHWAKIQTQGKKEMVEKIVDPRLQDVPIDEAMQVFFVALLSVQEHSVERPAMREVVQMLAQAKQPNTFHMQ
ncbi:hypothetical protein Nepgr_029565 [Nepenthes gracilis]|uniref:non-specific serine/threonine protein kinase n=1 Tax=Nepenthes gracilis TaxID=150966 RepID=A0AAD3TFL5_NEPGR|nr:hypothetical protein Nepgr_029565 [Nepenthes gracilis]